MTKQQLIEDNMNLVYRLIHREYPTYIHDEDLIQCGMLGLCNAADKWDESKSAFSTFATICIRNEIKYEFRKRAKQQGILSLDYEIKNGDTTCDFVTLGDLIVGEEDVPYVDLTPVYKHMNEEERRICELALTGLSGREIGEIVGRSHEFVYQVIRKFKSLWGYANED